MPPDDGVRRVIRSIRDRACGPPAGNEPPGFLNSSSRLRVQARVDTEPVETVTVDDGLLLSNLRGLVIRIDQAGVILEARGAIDGIAGYSAEELVGMTAGQLVSPDSFTQLVESFGQAGGAPVYERPLPFPITFVSRSGELEPCDVLPVGYVDEQGPGWISTITPRRLYSVAYDIVEAVLEGAPLVSIALAIAARDGDTRSGESRVQTTYVVTGIGSPDVCVHAVDGDTAFADALATEAGGTSNCFESLVDDGAIHSFHTQLLGPSLARNATRCGYEVAHVGAVSDGAKVCAAVVWMIADADAMHVRLHAEMIRKGYLRLLRSTLVRDRAERVLLEAATIDPVTGLGNRRLFEQQIAAADPSHAISVLYVDLDRFKAVNDDFGHDVGDRVLAVVGARLAGVCRGDSVVTRIGGDEFAVFLPGISREAAAVIADRIERSIAEPLRLENAPTNITATVGMSVSNGGVELRDLITDADMAMLATKRRRSAAGRVPAPV